ncbi:hypothetical protein PCANC_15178 [Puccinia coronata f. sp. avenae]|uniref:Superoxide dismutase copper/zinc binding domain-containing protein n=1 Tax=Puccinia coronata f. sp. avenae TaxID=200324 RepID=A0A2N5UJG4_9BASI|nr:hypothetical protein PCANC_24277 [Puccinia coronata f. sp. avenae]PLW37902.1 hypothetical protein PCANC_15178 [Puccinia coronata f. sp. avenae]
MHLIVLALSLLSITTAFTVTADPSPTPYSCLRAGMAEVAGPGISGTFHFRLFGNEKDVMTLVNFQVHGLQKNKKYPYHIHESPIDNTDCQSAKGHFNPTKSILVGKCTKEKRASCETGDLAGKFGPLVGTGTTVTGRYVDSSLVMKQTSIGILGRSIVIHDGETGARLACGTIKANPNRLGC